MKALTVIETDGGRLRETGKEGKSRRDCAVRALAVGTGLGYKVCWDLITEANSRDRITRNRSKKGHFTAEYGIRTPTLRRLMKDLGWEWVPTMFIGSGCQVHARADELPHYNRMILCLSRHVCFVDNLEGRGLLYDTHDCTRDGTRCVYGYWTPKENLYDSK